MALASWGQACEKGLVTWDPQTCTASLVSRSLDQGYTGPQGGWGLGLWTEGWVGVSIYITRPHHSLDQGTAQQEGIWARVGTAQQEGTWAQGTWAQGTCQGSCRGSPWACCWTRAQGSWGPQGTPWGSSTPATTGHPAPAGQALELWDPILVPQVFLQASMKAVSCFMLAQLLSAPLLLAAASLVLFLWLRSLVVFCKH